MDFGKRYERVNGQMARLELLTMLYSLDVLLEEAKPETAREVIKKLIIEAESEKKK